MSSITNGDYPDSLIVTGIPTLDGTYPCNIVGMLLEGTPHTLTNREGHRVKIMSGVRAGELWEAMEAGDNDVMLALAAVILTRQGKRFNEDLLWDAPMGSGIELDIKEREDTEEDPPKLQPTKPPEGSGGETSSLETSESPESDPSPTGTLDSSPSDPPTSEI